MKSPWMDAIRRRAGLTELDEARFDELAARELRRVRLSAVYRQTGMNTAASAVNAVVLVIAFHGHAPPLMLLAWFYALMVLGVLLPTLFMARGVGRRPKGSARSPARLTRRIMPVALVWTVAPFLFLPHADGLRLGLLLMQMADMMAAGTYAMMGVPRAALWWAGTLGAGYTAAFVLAPEPMWGAAVLSLLFTTLLVRNVVYHAIAVTRHFAESQALAEQREVTALLLADYENASNEWRWQTGVDGVLTRLPRPLLAILGWSEAHARSRPLFDLLEDGDADGSGDLARMGAIVAARGSFHDVDLRLRDVETGRCRWVTVRGAPVSGPDGEYCGYRGIATEVTETRLAEERVRYLAEFDTLTGLPNRASLNEHLAQWVSEGRSFALLALDLDRFKAVNDTMGHPAGDELLRRVADGLRGLDGPEGTVPARASGDEFFVIVPAAGEDDDALLAAAERVAGEIVDALARPFELEAGQATIGSSVGIALHPRDATDRDDLLSRADLALYAAKAAGRGCHRVYCPSMDRDARERRALEDELGRALGAGQLGIVFQPIVALKGGERTCRGMEAFIRWTHPTRGQVPPARFLPIAEANGAIVPIGEWVVAEACREAASWTDPLTVTVNVSPRQLASDGFVDVVLAALADAGLPASRLELDVPESALSNDRVGKALGAIALLRGAGVRVTLDELGAREGTLSAICALAFDRIKISPALVAALDDGDGTTGARARLMVGTLVDLATRLGVDATGEGIERTSQVETLRALGCSAGQGFLFARPLPPDGAAALAGGRRAGKDAPRSRIVYRGRAKA